ncbi:MAG: hypothetical protein WA130_08380 [Candidatus Methanoperedens sp.]
MPRRKAGAHAVDDTWLDKRKWEYGNDSGDGVGGKGLDDRLSVFELVYFQFFFES